MEKSTVSEIILVMIYILVQLVKNYVKDWQNINRS